MYFWEWVEDVHWILLVPIMSNSSELEKNAPPDQRFCQCGSNKLKSGADAFKEDNGSEGEITENGERAEVWPGAAHSDPGYSLTPTDGGMAVKEGSYRNHLALWIFAELY